MCFKKNADLTVELQFHMIGLSCFSIFSTDRVRYLVGSYMYIRVCAWFLKLSSRPNLHVYGADFDCLEPLLLASLVRRNGHAPILAVWRWAYGSACCDTIFEQQWQYQQLREPQQWRQRERKSSTTHFCCGPDSTCQFALS